MRAQPISPLVYELVEETTVQTTVTDVLFGTVAVIGGLLVVGLALGLVCASALIGYRRLRGHDRVTGARSESTQLGLNSPASGR